MMIEIRKLTSDHRADVGKCSSSFNVRTRLILHAEGSRVSYMISQLSEEYEKDYRSDKIDVDSYLADPERVIFLAYDGETVVGEIVVMKFWNNTAYIDHLAVDTQWRRQGIGTKLIDQVVEWAREKGLPALMLETQDDNVPACRFYEAYGFELGGFDRLLYKGLKPDTEEIALFWYLPVNG